MKHLTDKGKNLTFEALQSLRSNKNSDDLRVNIVTDRVLSMSFYKQLTHLLTLSLPFTEVRRDFGLSFLTSHAVV